MLSWIVFYRVGFGHETAHVAIERWITSGELDIGWAFKIDTLTAVMFVVVTTVSALVHVYSIGYMAEDDSRPRFFAYLSGFTFAMLMLVTSDNLVQMFFGWEGVGLFSYLLIGFWYTKPEANAAAIKAFVVNRVGDFGFALGIFGLFAVFNTVNLDQLFDAAPGMAGKSFEFLGYQVDILTTLSLLLFMGAMGKSAQFLLHTWLPDAMEGPTPVSALIHAATMVTAGVFMVARLSPIFEQAPDALQFVVLIGAITAFFAATVGLVQNDIKRVIAYSTCSQLGYMFVACGVGAYQAGIFHLFTHAFFKALLFLGAGSVIHAMHHEQDMRKMGGLRPKLPYTWALMLIGTLALTGFGIPHLAGFSGFYSKDTIIEAAHAAHTPGDYAFWALVIAAFMTSFYSWRLMFMTFHGPTRADKKTFKHAHESPPVMLVPLAVLALGAVVAGAGTHYFVGEGQRGVLGQGDLQRRAQPHPACPARGAELGAVGADHRHGRRLRHRLPLLHRRAVAAGTHRARVPAAVPVPPQQVVLRRALRLHLRAPDLLARQRSVEGRRHQDHQRADRRHRRGRLRRHAARRAAADGLHLPLRLRHADRRRAARQLLHVHGRGALDGSLLRPAAVDRDVHAAGRRRHHRLPQPRRPRATPAGWRCGRRSSPS